MITFRPLTKFDKQATIVLCDEEQVKQKSFSFSNASLKKELNSIINSKQFSGKDGQLFPVVVNNQVVLCVGVGQKKSLSLTALRISVRRALLSPYLREIKSLELIVHEQKDNVIQAVIEAVLIGTYTWKKYHTKDKNDKSVDDKQVVIIASKKKIYEDAIKVCLGANLTRDLINDNADTVTSVHVGKVVRGLIKGKKNISLEVLNEKEMKAKGLGLHLAVNQGSNKPPKLIIVKYNGASTKDNYTALVGKGVTFDTGGINLKPSGHIEAMRMDMSGAASVVGILKNVINLKLKKNILFVCGLAENAIGSKAYKPGDVIRGYAGKTVEIANTDAEGRLVLADAISYVVKNYKPSHLVDIATLTGACIVALGLDYTGLVSNDDAFAAQILKSAETTDDRAWRLPIYPELKDSVKSKIADICNLGSPKGAGGTITAAEFLRQFTEGTKWVHLDIAGTAFVEGTSRMYFAHGATGSSVRLLTHYLQNN